MKANLFLFSWRMTSTRTVSMVSSSKVHNLFVWTVNQVIVFVVINESRPVSVFMEDYKHKDSFNGQFFKST